MEGERLPRKRPPWHCAVSLNSKSNHCSRRLKCSQSVGSGRTISSCSLCNPLCLLHPPLFSPPPLLPCPWNPSIWELCVAGDVSCIVWVFMVICSPMCCFYWSSFLIEWLQPAICASICLFRPSTSVTTNPPITAQAPLPLALIWQTRLRPSFSGSDLLPRLTVSPEALIGQARL